MLPGMPVLISPTAAIMLRAMVTKPKAKHLALEVAEAIGRPVGTIRPIMVRLHKVGWLSAETEPRVQFMPRTFYQFTPDGLKHAREELKTWEFKDE